MVRPFINYSRISPHEVLASLRIDDGDEDDEDDVDFPRGDTGQLGVVGGYGDGQGERVRRESSASASGSRSRSYGSIGNANGQQQQRRQSRTSPHPNQSTRLPIRHVSSSPSPSPSRSPELGNRLFVRALFNFEASDPSALSFREGDIIEVITRLESGWWDGMMGRTRGWFPSNFVEEVEVEIEESEGEGLGLVVGEGIEGSRLARRSVLGMEEIMRNGGGDELWSVGDDGGGGDGGEDFVAMREEVARRRMLDAGPVSGSEQFGARPSGAVDVEEFGVGRVGRREREATDRTVMGLEPGITLRAEPLVEAETEVEANEGGGDAWVPTLTPDGHVYYHNTLTGEDSWEIPVETPTGSDADPYEQKGDYLKSLSSTAQSSGPFPNTATDSADPEPGFDSFQPPPKALQAELAHPWVARLSDDGREYFYFNRETGEKRKTPPISIDTSVRDVNDDINRLSMSSSSQDASTIPPPPPPRPRAVARQSVEIRRQAVNEWQKRTNDALAAQTAQPPKFTIDRLMDNLNEAIRQLFEAGIAGSAAEEEMSRAIDMGNQTGRSAASLRERGAVELLKTSHDTLLSRIRELFSTFGFVGPLFGGAKVEGMEKRPSWTGDMSLIGCIGLLSANVHLAITANREFYSSGREGGLTEWAEVLRTASRLKDLIAGFPSKVGGGGNEKGLMAWLGVDKAKVEVVGGKWGFGSSEGVMRTLDANSVGDVGRTRGEFGDVLRDSGDVIEVMRAVERFKMGILNIDIATGIDIDGDSGDLSDGSEAKAYAELVEQAQQAIRDLDSAMTTITTSTILLYYSLPNGNTTQPVTILTKAVNAAHILLISLLTISQSQKQASSSSTILRTQIGARSPNTHLRPQSILSNQSRISKISDRSSSLRSKARGLEEEFLDQEDLETERRDKAMGSGPLSGISASGSFTSLPGQGQGRREVVSATSSTTSLVYQRSEVSETGSGGTGKGNRSSFMKFMRGRSGSDGLDETRAAPRLKNAGPSRKLAQLLGENVTVPTPVQETPWYLGEDYLPSEIIFDDKGSVKAGTLNALVARLTHHGQTDTAFFQAFLLTFRSFTTGVQLSESLIRRYDIAMPDGLDYSQEQEWKRLKQTPIRLRVANTIKGWLDTYFAPDEDMSVLDKIEKFAKTMLLETGMNQFSDMLITMTTRRRTGENDSARRVTSGSVLSPPAPLVPRPSHGKTLRLGDIDPKELARQLTILEFNCYQLIKPVECLEKRWNREDSEQKAPHVRKVIYTANVLSGWVSQMCLKDDDPRGRAIMMRYFITLAMELKALNNFSSMAAIAAGLNGAPVARLKRTKDLLQSKFVASKAELDRTMDSTKNFQNYKDMLKTVNPPCVPFFGFYLSALTFIEDGNRDIVTANSGMSQSASSSSLTSVGRPVGVLQPLSSSSTQDPSQSQTITRPPLINFFKRSLTAEILRDIQQYQSQPYVLHRCKIVWDYLTQSLETCDKTYNLDKLYARSLQLEPREKEEERITRLLHDSKSQQDKEKAARSLAARTRPPPNLQPNLGWFL